MWMSESKVVSVKAGWGGDTKSLQCLKHGNKREPSQHDNTQYFAVNIRVSWIPRSPFYLVKKELLHAGGIYWGIIEKGSAISVSNYCPLQHATGTSHNAPARVLCHDLLCILMMIGMMQKVYRGLQCETNLIFRPKQCPFGLNNPQKAHISIDLYLCIYVPSKLYWHLHAIRWRHCV